jgi:hypothetical protein
MLKSVNDGVMTINLDIRQLEKRAWYGQLSRPSRCSLRQEQFAIWEHPRKPTTRNAWFKQWNKREVLWWFGLQYHGKLFCWSYYYPSWPNHCKGIRGQVYHMISKRYFRTMQFSKKTIPLFTKLELFSHGSKSMEVNFKSFPGQHNHQIWKSQNNRGQFWRLEWGTDSYLQHV